MKDLRVLIVDDEYPARMELRHHLSQFKNVYIVGEAGNANEAYQLITALNYDVVFLDIRMPGTSGLELVKALQSLEVPPRIVFVSAYEEHAIDAFRVKAFDYILKPIETNRLKEVIDRLFTESDKIKVTPNKQNHLQIIPGELKGTIYPVKVQDIIYVYSEKENIYLRVRQGEDLFIRYTIRDLEAKLDEAMFFRPHRCFVVNIHHVYEIRPGFHGSYSLIMEDRDKSEIPVSRNNAKILKRVFNL